ncbi:MAG: universal stress protein [Candidatus Sulfotelmatobacter sp.]
MSVAELNIPIETPIETKESSAGFRNILVATDFSEPSRRALCDALLLAAENHARLSIIHVLRVDRKYAALENPPDLDLDWIAAKKRIKALEDEFAPLQKIDSAFVRRGPVAEHVRSVIEEEAIDLLVIGTHGRGGLTKLALGSVAEELLRVAPCPVMTLGPMAEIPAAHHETDPREPGFHSILFATDFGKGSRKALPLALALARSGHAKLTLLHMMPMPATSNLSTYVPAAEAASEFEQWESTSRKRAVQELKDCLPAETGLEQEPRYVVGTDFLAEGILTASVKFGIDLIVMGANHAASARMAAHTPWTSVHEVIRHAPCAVLTVGG